LELLLPKLQEILGITRKSLPEFANEKLSLRPKMAVSIVQATNATPEGWMNMQTKIDLRKVLNNVGKNHSFSGSGVFW